MTKSERCPRQAYQSSGKFDTSYLDSLLSHLTAARLGMTLITLISLICYSYRSDMPPKHDINVTIANLHLHSPRLTPVESWSRKLRLSYLVSSLLLVLLISDAKHASSRISDESCTDNQVWGQIHMSAW